VRATLGRASAQGGRSSFAPFRLSFVQADLFDEKGWAEVVQGCECVHHVASPFPEKIPKNEDELIVPARDGTLRVLRAAHRAGVRRVVLTSSFAAIGYGHADRDTPFDETTWTYTGVPLAPYVKSKTLAERAAWDFVAEHGGSLELVTVNPVGVFGPVFGRDYSTSILVVQRLMDGAVPGCPNVWFGAVDVRDVADLHLRAMTNPAAKNERFLAVAGDFVTPLDVAKILKRRLGDRARRVPTRELPNWLVHVAAFIDPAVKQILPDLGKKRNATSEKAKRILGWNPRSVEEAIVATAESLAEHGLLKK
jgi:nucleoside-diphosphate-sugar epimerase